MNALLHWFGMNGYAMYVWPAYGIVFVVLTVNILSIKRQSIRTRKRLFRWFKESRL